MSVGARGGCGEVGCAMIRGWGGERLCKRGGGLAGGGKSDGGKMGWAVCNKGFLQVLYGWASSSS